MCVCVTARVKDYLYKAVTRYMYAHSYSIYNKLEAQMKYTAKTSDQNNKGMVA